MFYVNHLKQHILIHTGEKLFIRNVYDKSFARSGDLVKHLLVHTGDTIQL